MSRKAWLILAALGLVAAFGIQFKQISKLKADLSTLRTEIATGAPVETKAGAAAPASPSNPEEIAGLQTRLAQLERNIANFSKGSRVMPMEAMSPQPTEDELVRLEQRLLDPTASDADRMKALRSLRRANKTGDEFVTQTLGLLQSSTNVNFRRELLANLEGVTNAALKQPLVALLDSEGSDVGFREQVVNALRRFADDPAVETKLWDVALNDPNTRVRDQAREALARAPATPERVEQLMARAANDQASLDERLVSFRALRLAKSHTPELVSEFATLAQNSTDPIARAKLFKSFNGLTDPTLMLPLVNGLQDTDPVVRQNAANALSEFPDPRVQQWLTHLIQNDNDPAVKREAHAALEHSQRLGAARPK